MQEAIQQYSAYNSILVYLYGKNGGRDDHKVAEATDA